MKKLLFILFLLMLPSVYPKIEATIKPAIISNSITSLINPISGTNPEIYQGFLIEPLVEEVEEEGSDQSGQIILYKDKPEMNITKEQVPFKEKPRIKQILILIGSIVTVCLAIVCFLFLIKRREDEDKKITKLRKQDEDIFGP